MGYPMMHHSRKGRSMDFPNIDLSDIPSIPLPMAVAGALGSLMLGAGVGMMMGRMKKSNGHDSSEIQQRLDQLMSAKKHHHHGDGGMACGCKEGSEKAEAKAEKHNH